tara:strand:+ start:1343 stop:1582 length:240 start_codon:yes stop_codon:yes gene_type:complete
MAHPKHPLITLDLTYCLAHLSPQSIKGQLMVTMGESGRQRLAGALLPNRQLKRIDRLGKSTLKKKIGAGYGNMTRSIGR